jgi:hypothetical protein
MRVPFEKNCVVKVVELVHKEVFVKPVLYSRPIRYDITNDGPAWWLAMFSLEKVSRSACLSKPALAEL